MPAGNDPEDPDVVALRERLAAVRRRTTELMEEQRKLAEVIALMEEKRRLRDEHGRDHP